MKIAIIGSGISGLSAAYLLHQQHEIKVFEKAPVIGGHTATKNIEVDGKQYAIDTGFIVYNDWTYPNFIRLMNELGVENQPTEMGFSVTANQGTYEYSGTNLNTLFCQRKNLFNRFHLRMIKDILRFNKEAISDLDQGKLSESLTLGDYLKAHHYSQNFIDYYLVPMGCAIWSASTANMLEFPLLFFVKFFKNHGLLSVNNRPQWRVLKGGSRSYLPKITQGFHHLIQTNTQIACVKRALDSATLVFQDNTQETFDQVIFACHSDQALALLETPTAAEQDILGAIAYKDNDVVLHTDQRLLPKHRSAWSSWNYLLDSTQQQSATLTYNMNILQGIKSEHEFCVTLNATDKIDEDKVLGKYNYAHPVFTLDAIAAQAKRDDVSGQNRTWFCGAYWRNGFHEDGCLSGIQVARSLGADW